MPGSAWMISGASSWILLEWDLQMRLYPRRRRADNPSAIYLAATAGTQTIGGRSRQVRSQVAP